jgi:hypothetical protein
MKELYEQETSLAQGAAAACRLVECKHGQKQFSMALVEWQTLEFLRWSRQ